jgi:hypothetical protein
MSSRDGRDRNCAIRVPFVWSDWYFKLLWRNWVKSLSRLHSCQDRSGNTRKKQGFRSYRVKGRSMPCHAGISIRRH